LLLQNRAFCPKQKFFKLGYGNNYTGVLGLQAIDDAVKTKISGAKRNCILCCGRWRLRPVEKEKGAVLDAIRYLVTFFDGKYNELRRKDASGEEITAAIENKRFCMDLLEKCQRCSKDVDTVNRLLLARFR